METRKLVEEAILSTLVLGNKTSIHFAVDKIIKIFEDDKQRTQETKTEDDNT